MNDYNLINNVINNISILGKKEVINDNLIIIPINNIKLNLFDIDTNIVNNNCNSNDSNIIINPIALITISNNNISILNINTKNNNLLDNMIGNIENIDLNNILKLFK